MDPSAEDGWSLGRISVPLTTGKLWFASAPLDRSLPYEIALPAREVLAAQIVAYLYKQHSLEKGQEKWRHDLLEGSGDAFEVALINALSRLGIPVLFAGQLTQEGRGTGGTATPGFDIVALNFSRRHAVLLSAKGTSRSANEPPRFPSDKDLADTVTAAEAIGQLLPDWTVWGIVVCQAPSNRLGQFAERKDIQVWGRAELENLLLTDTYQTLARQLWTPPWDASSAFWRFADAGA